MLGKNMFLCSEKKQETSNRHSELHFDILRQISFEFENWGSEKYNVNNELLFLILLKKKKKKKTLKISRKEIKTRRSLVENNVFYVRES